MLSRLGIFFLDTLQTILLALAIFMLAYLFLTQPHQVRGHSMDPNFFDGEYLLSDKLSYRFGEPTRGDVVVFNAPPNRREDYIKRIIGLPGETISINSGTLLINGKTLKEPYLPRSAQTGGGAFLVEGTSYRINSDEYIVLGDNRDHSSDSRSWGPIKRKDIVGRAWFVYWPPRLVGFVSRVNPAFAVKQQLGLPLSQ